MSNTESQKDLWKETASNVKNDLDLPMDVIASQTQNLTKNWVNGFAEMMFDNIAYKNGMVDLTSKLKPRMINVSYNAIENGQQVEKTIQMPLLGAVDYPALALDDVKLDLNYQVDTNDELKQNTTHGLDTKAQVNGGLFGYGFSASTKLSLAQSEDRTRKTDTRAKLSVSAQYSRLKDSEAISRIADVLMNNAVNNVDTKSSPEKTQQDQSPSEDNL
ncbi:TPA: DUF2589 domain-containing protein [Yersinia enterocolitica]|nr:DUF2589 domain-containing protein [Yersinia enterocolitica]